MKKTIICYCLSILIVILNTSSTIVRRHDRSDEDYLALGAKFPSVCKVGKRGGDGTLIASKWILTAAHVAQGMYQREGENLKVYFANDDNGIKVSRVFLHSDFRPMQGADIALLLLERPVENITPASIYKKQDEHRKPIVIVGHGDSRDGNGGEWITDGKKRGATNIIDEIMDDRIIFDFDAPVDGDATEMEGTAGRGDSGGPAFILVNDEPFVAGISSAGSPGKAGPGTYGATEHYTRVSTFSKWILEVMEDPSGNNAMTKGSAANTQQQPKVGNGRQNGGPLPGLGLMLMQDGNKIRIGGKADPQVPESFRSVMFKPPSYLIGFNGEKYSALEEFKTIFEKLSRGDNFSIEFSIQGEIRSYEGNKM